MIKVISFDFDGTITKTTFADLFWLEGLPKLYAQKYGIDLERAKSIIFKEYEKIGKERLGWYDPVYWFKKFRIDYSWRKLMEDYSFAIEAYPDAMRVINILREKGYNLIIISNAKKEFIEIQMKKLGIEDFFYKVFSTVSDFKMVKKEGEVYLKICKILNIDKEEIFHVGDDYKFDFLAPRKMGIKAVYLDRNSKEISEYSINSLDHLPDILNRWGDL